MFTVYHFVWLAVCAALIAGALIFLKKRRPPLKNVLSVCCVLCVASELVKDLSVIKMVPSADGSMLLPYMEMQHLPFHLCSIQILLIFFVRFARPGKARTTVLAFMYPTALIGAALALAMPSIFSSTIEVSQAFTHPLAYQFFLYHSMLVVLGAYIPFAARWSCARSTISPRWASWGRWPWPRSISTPCSPPPPMWTASSSAWNTPPTSFSPTPRPCPSR